jgi:NAD(P)-dependent dehydrogenase (short-subunit alcohol dehydrogenase family)
MTGSELRDKVCLITGATSGIGAAAAEALARRGATVVVVGRSRERCAAVLERVRRASGHSSVDSLTADLSSQTEVRRLAREFEARYPRLDVLINNAGAIFKSRRLSADGIEMTFALNHLAYFLLTNLLLDTIKASSPARVVNVSSCGHEKVAGLDFDDLLSRRGYRPFQAYFRSKLANLLFTYELSRRLAGTGVTANAVHPGLVATNIGRSNGWSWRVMKPVFDRVFGLKYVSAEEGARGVVHLASSADVEGVSGRYFAGPEPAESSEASRDEAAALRLWRESESLTEANRAPPTSLSRAI